jgi:hypothetical protein
MNDEKVTESQTEATVKSETTPSKRAAVENEAAKPSGEVGGPKGPEPTRYGDWEKKGRCIDF